MYRNKLRFQSNGSVPKDRGRESEDAA